MSKILTIFAPATFPGKPALSLDGSNSSRSYVGPGNAAEALCLKGICPEKEQECRTVKQNHNEKQNSKLV